MKSTPGHHKQGKIQALMNRIQFFSGKPHQPHDTQDIKKPSTQNDLSSTFIKAELLVGQYFV